VNIRFVARIYISPHVLLTAIGTKSTSADLYDPPADGARDWSLNGERPSLLNCGSSFVGYLEERVGFSSEYRQPLACHRLYTSKDAALAVSSSR
jgi:hypothetical protein